LKDYEEMLPGKEFFRIHKAHLININHINRYIKGEGGEVIMSDGSCLEVSRYKKGEFMARFNP
jgi:two-component system, LytTR family, response regulator